MVYAITINQVVRLVGFDIDRSATAAVLLRGEHKAIAKFSSRCAVRAVYNKPKRASDTVYKAVAARLKVCSRSLIHTNT